MKQFNGDLKVKLWTFISGLGAVKMCVRGWFQGFVAVQRDLLSSGISCSNLLVPSSRVKKSFKMGPIGCPKTSVRISTLCCIVSQKNTYLICVCVVEGTLFTTACHSSLSCARWIQSTSCLYIQDSFYKFVWVTTSKSRNIKRRIIMVMDLGQTQKWDTKFDLKTKICSTDEVCRYEGVLISP